MGLISSIKYAIQDKARSRQIAQAESGGGGRHAKPKGGRHQAPKTCGHTWEDKGIPGSVHASYPHTKHKCGDAPHNRGTHHCWGGEGWTCNATQG